VHLLGVKLRSGNSRGSVPRPVSSFDYCEAAGGSGRGSPEVRHDEWAFWYVSSGYTTTCAPTARWGNARQRPRRSIIWPGFLPADVGPLSSTREVALGLIWRGICQVAEVDRPALTEAGLGWFAKGRRGERAGPV
jgi:hypothetical protein